MKDQGGFCHEKKISVFAVCDHSAYYSCLMCIGGQLLRECFIRFGDCGLDHDDDRGDHCGTGRYNRESHRADSSCTACDGFALHDTYLS